MSQSAKFNFTYLFPIVIICYTFSLLWGWIPYTHSVITIAVGLVAAVAVSYKYFSQRAITYLLFYFIVMIINVISGDYHLNTFRKVVDIAMQILLPVLMTYGFFISNDEKLLNITMKLVFGMLIINAIGSLFVESIFPGSIRAINGTIKESGEMSVAIPYYRYGLASYALPHALPCIIPVLIMGIKTATSKSTRWVFIACLVSCLILVYLSGATIPVLAAFIAVILGVFTNTKAGSSRLILLGLVTIVLMLIATSEEIMLPFLRGLDDMMGNEGYFHKKILDFENLIVYGDTTGDMEQREGLYTETWHAIVSHPILGVNYKIGGHSTLLDTWGCLGLVGFIPFVLFIFKQVQYSAKGMHNSSKFYYYEGVFLAFIMLSLKNVAAWDSWLFLFTVLPLLTYYIERKQNIISPTSTR